MENDEALLEIMRGRNQAYRVWRRDGSEKSRREYRRLRNLAKRHFAASRKNYVCAKMSHDRKAWKGVNDFVMQPKSGENGPASLSAEKANEFNRHFASVGPKIAAEISSGNNTDRPLPPRPPCVTTAGLTLRAITLPELSSALGELSASQAVGLDGLPIAAVRKCFAVIGPHILHLVNSSICTRTFPAAWKEASVVPLFKSGSRDEASSFRPISILSVLSKICDKVVCRQVSDHLIENNLLAPTQYAYRKSHSTEDALIDVTDWMVRRMDEGHVVAATSVDLSRAFDSVDHSLLLDKLSWYGIDSSWFASYLCGRRQLVRGGNLSLSLTHGVPQGSLTGPILFSIFTNDLASFLPHGRLVSYADDTTLLDSSPVNHLNNLKARQEETLKSVQSYFKSNSLKMNPTKTTLLLVGTCQSLKNTSSFSVTVSDHVLAPSTSVKMLGMVVDQKLSWEKHISYVVKKCNSILFSLYKIRHHLTPECRETLVQAHVFPHIIYCLSVWGGAAACHLHRIQKLINFAARIVTGARKFDHISPILDNLGWLKIEDIVKQRDSVKVWKALNDKNTPKAVSSLFTRRSEVSNRKTRATSNGDLQIPPFQLSLARSSFSYRAAQHWNSLRTAVSRTGRSFF